MTDPSKNMRTLILWGCLFAAAGSLTANANPFTVRQLADTRLVNRNPVISDTGLVAWNSFDPGGQLLSGTEIFVYRNGETFSISEGATQGANSNARVYSNAVVWVSALTRREPDQETTWVLFDPELDDDIPELDARYGVTEETDNPIDQQFLIPLGEERDGDHFVWRRADPNDDTPRTPRRSPTGNNEIMYWNDGDLVRLTVDNRNDFSPGFWGDTIAWQKARGWPFGWEIMVWIDGHRMQMTTNYWYDMAPRVHNRQVVWYGWDGTDYEIFKYDHTAGTLEQLTDNNYDDVSPLVWDGVVVWEGFPSLHADIFMWRNGEISQLSYNVDDDINPSLWNGQVVWQGFDGDFFQIYHYDGTNTHQLTNSLYDNINPQIRDGLIVWMGYVDNFDAEIFVWTGGPEPIRLTDNDYEDLHARTAGGRVVWQADFDGDSHIFLAEPDGP